MNVLADDLKIIYCGFYENRLKWIKNEEGIYVHNGFADF